jgi:hypothetical protein
MGHVKSRADRDAKLVGELKAMAIELFQPESVFGRPLGRDEKCLSALQIVEILQGGAKGASLEHLLECQVCLENLTQLASVNLQSAPDFVSRALRASGEVSLAEPRRTERPLAAILGLPDALRIDDAEAQNLVLSFTVIPAFKRELLRAIDARSLRLEGAVIAAAGTIEDRVDTNRDGQTDYLRVKFEHARLAPRVRQGVADRQNVIDTVRLYGVLGDEKREEFVGQGLLEFVAR